jgi:hypothetical protein
MTMFGSQWLANAGGAGYTIDQSIRFNKTDNSGLTVTPLAGNRDLFTLSVWFKLGLVTSTEYRTLFCADTSNTFQISFLPTANGDYLRFQDNGVRIFDFSQSLRDPSAWYHLVYAYDSAQATASDRCTAYLNGEEVTDLTGAAYPAQNVDSKWNSAVVHGIGYRSATDNWDGYLAEIHHIEGAALDPTSFGEYNANGVWIPKAYTNASGYGNNGFYITGEDSTFLGQDVRTSGDQVNSFQASQYTGATSDYTFSDGRVEADTSNRAIRTVDTFTGDFEFTWRYVNMANFVIGLYEIDEDATFSSTSSAGNMQNMTDSWYVQTSSVSANRDIKYGSTTVVNATTIANGDVWKMTRESGVIKIYRNASLIHTFTQTSTNEVRLVIAQGDAAADANQIAWVDNSTLGNNFFSTGLATTDQMLDTPTLNFPTFNPLNVDAYTLSDGNLNTGAAGDAGAVSTLAIDVTDSDGFYFEVSSSTAATYPDIGLQDADALALAGTTTISAYNTGRYTYQGNNGNFNDQGSTSSYGATYTTNIIGVLVQSGNLYFSKDGTIQNSGTAAKTGLTGMMYARVSYSAGSGTHANFTINFGQSAFAHDPGSTYKAWNTANLATPSIKDGSAHFQPTLYTGNGTAIGSGGLEVNQSGNSTFQPDFAWIKNRTTAGNEHDLYDAVRGATKVVFSSTSGAEATVSEGLASFDTDGFTVGNRGEVNTSGNSMVAWQWKANGTGSSNTDGSINTTATSVNTTAGFSISTYTGNGTSGATIGHGLGLVPALVIVKRRDGGSGYSWYVQHKDVGPTKALFLDSTSAGGTSANYWNNTAPTSSVFSVGNDTSLNANSGTFLAYCFAEIPGYSSIGSYEGNGSTDGTFVYTGFRPSFLLVKNIDAGESWQIRDSKRDPFNVSKEILYPNTSGAEATSGGGQFGDLLSNGFKWRGADPGNNSAATFIYMAFAEHPFGGDGVAPATAR